MAEKETEPLESKCHQTRTCLKYVYFYSCFQQCCPKKAKTGAELLKRRKHFLHGYCFSSLCQFGHYLLHAYVYSCMHVCQGTVFAVWRKTQKKHVLGRVHKHSSVQPHATTKPLPSDTILTYHPTKFPMQYSRISPFMKPSFYSCRRGTAHARCGNWLLNNWPVWEAVGRRRLLEVNITASWGW